MQKRRLGNTDLELTTVGLGTWAMGGPWQYGWGPQDDHEAIGGAAASLARASATAKLDRDRGRELVRLLETPFTREEKVLFPVAETRMTAYLSITEGAKRLV